VSFFESLIHAHRRRTKCGDFKLIFDGDRLRYCSLGLFFDGNTNLELRLCLGGAVELLVDGDVFGLKKDIRRSRIGVSLKCNLGISRDVQECTDIRFKSSWDHIPKRHLGATRDALEHHLDGDGMVQTSVMRGGSHFGDVSRKDMVAWGGDEDVNAVIGGRDNLAIGGDKMVVTRRENRQQTL
jgi:hypothetical protein